MSDYPITQQPQSTNSIFTLLPDEYIRFEYNYKPGCCCFSSKTTTVTNMRLITRVIKTPTIFSRQTSTGKEKNKEIFLTNINNIKQIKSAIPSSQNKWWMKCLDILTCQCDNEQINWLELCRGMENLSMNTNDKQKTVLIQKF
jgi:hypothetical protein